MSARVERTATDDRGNRSDRDQRVNTARIVLMTVGASAVKVNCISSREEREHRGNDRQVERGGDCSQDSFPGERGDSPPCHSESQRRWPRRGYKVGDRAPNAGDVPRSGLT